MGGTAPANQLRLSFTGSEDGAAETETCRVAKPLWRTTPWTSRALAGSTYWTAGCGPACPGGVAGQSGQPLPLCRFTRTSPTFP